MKNKSRFFSMLFLFATLTGCVTQDQLNKEMALLSSERRIENQQIFLSIGERTFDVDKSKLIKAFIATFSDKNIAVVNLDKEVGYLLAEGGGLLPPDKHKEIGMAIIKEQNEKTSVTWQYTPGATTEVFTVNIYEQGENRTKAKVGISHKAMNNTQAAYLEPIPIMLTALFEELWSGLEKSLFIQRNMD